MSFLLLIDTADNTPGVSQQQLHIMCDMIFRVELFSCMLGPVKECSAEYHNSDNFFIPNFTFITH